MEVERHAVHALRALDRDESRLACLEISEIETVAAGTDGELLLPLRRVCPVSTMRGEVGVLLVSPPPDRIEVDGHFNLDERLGIDRTDDALVFDKVQDTATVRISVLFHFVDRTVGLDPSSFPYSYCHRIRHIHLVTPESEGSAGGLRCRGVTCVGRPPPFVDLAGIESDENRAVAQDATVTAEDDVDLPALVSERQPPVLGIAVVRDEHDLRSGVDPPRTDPRGPGHPIRTTLVHHVWSVSVGNRIPCLVGVGDGTSVVSPDDRTSGHLKVVERLLWRESHDVRAQRAC